MPNMDMLNVGVHVHLRSLVLSGKFSCHHPFNFKFSYNIYTPLYIPEKQVELHPSS
jgi:hypothetical protein